MSNKPIVTVQLSPAFLGPAPETQIAILCDRTLREVLHFASEHPRCFVFPFYTKTVDEVPDLSSLGESEDHIVVPHYVGNFSSIRSVISQILEVAYAEMDLVVDNDGNPAPRKIILDETPE